MNKSDKSNQCILDDEMVTVNSQWTYDLTVNDEGKKSLQKLLSLAKHPMNQHDTNPMKKNVTISRSNTPKSEVHYNSNNSALDEYTLSSSTILPKLHPKRIGKNRNRKRKEDNLSKRNSMENNDELIFHVMNESDESEDLISLACAQGIGREAIKSLLATAKQNGQKENAHIKKTGTKSIAVKRRRRRNITKSNQNNVKNYTTSQQSEWKQPLGRHELGIAEEITSASITGLDSLASLEQVGGQAIRALLVGAKSKIQHKVDTNAKKNSKSKVHHNSGRSKPKQSSDDSNVVDDMTVMTSLEGVGATELDFLRIESHRTRLAKNKPGVKTMLKPC